MRDVERLGGDFLAFLSTPFAQRHLPICERGSGNHYRQQEVWASKHKDDRAEEAADPSRDTHPAAEEPDRGEGPDDICGCRK